MTKLKNNKSKTIKSSTSTSSSSYISSLSTSSSYSNSSIYSSPSSNTQSSSISLSTSGSNVIEQARNSLKNDTESSSIFSSNKKNKKKNINTMILPSLESTKRLNNLLNQEKNYNENFFKKNNKLKEIELEIEANLQKNNYYENVSYNDTSIMKGYLSSKEENLKENELGKDKDNIKCKIYSPININDENSLKEISSISFSPQISSLTNISSPKILNDNKIKSFSSTHKSILSIPISKDNDDENINKDCEIDINKKNENEDLSKFSTYLFMGIDLNSQSSKSKTMLQNEDKYKEIEEFYKDLSKINLPSSEKYYYSPKRLKKYEKKIKNEAKLNELKHEIEQLETIISNLNIAIKKEEDKSNLSQLNNQLKENLTKLSKVKENYEDLNFQISKLNKNLYSNFDSSSTNSSSVSSPKNATIKNKLMYLKKHFNFESPKNINYLISPNASFCFPTSILTPMNLLPNPDEYLTKEEQYKVQKNKNNKFNQKEAELNIKDSINNLIDPTEFVTTNDLIEENLLNKTSRLNFFRHNYLCDLCQKICQGSHNYLKCSTCNLICHISCLIIYINQEDSTFNNSFSSLSKDSYLYKMFSDIENNNVAEIFNYNNYNKEDNESDESYSVVRKKNSFIFTSHALSRQLSRSSSFIVPNPSENPTSNKLTINTSLSPKKVPETTPECYLKLLTKTWTCYYCDKDIKDNKKLKKKFYYEIYLKKLKNLSQIIISSNWRSYIKRKKFNMLKNCVKKLKNKFILYKIFTKYNEEKKKKKFIPFFIKILSLNSITLCDRDVWKETTDIEKIKINSSNFSSSFTNSNSNIISNNTLNNPNDPNSINNNEEKKLSFEEIFKKEMEDKKEIKKHKKSWKVYFHIALYDFSEGYNTQLLRTNSQDFLLKEESQTTENFFNSNIHSALHKNNNLNESSTSNSYNYYTQVSNTFSDSNDIIIGGSNKNFHLVLTLFSKGHSNDVFLGQGIISLEHLYQWNAYVNREIIDVSHEKYKENINLQSNQRKHHYNNTNIKGLPSFSNNTSINSTENIFNLPPLYAPQQIYYKNTIELGNLTIPIKDKAGTLKKFEKRIAKITGSVSISLSLSNSIVYPPNYPIYLKNPTFKSTKLNEKINYDNEDSLFNTIVHPLSINLRNFSGYCYGPSIQDFLKVLMNLPLSNIFIIPNRKRANARASLAMSSLITSNKQSVSESEENEGDDASINSTIEDDSSINSSITKSTSITSISTIKKKGSNLVSSSSFVFPIKKIFINVVDTYLFIYSHYGDSLKLKINIKDCTCFTIENQKNIKQKNISTSSSSTTSINVNKNSIKFKISFSGYPDFIFSSYDPRDNIKWITCFLRIAQFYPYHSPLLTNIYYNEKENLSLNNQNNNSNNFNHYRFSSSLLIRSLKALKNNQSICLIKNEF